jgi:hypothetical protein
MCALVGRVTSDELVEVAALTFRGVVLIHQREIVVVECHEPLVPGDRLQRFAAAVTGEVQPDHPGIVVRSRSPDGRRLRTARFCPALDLVVIGRGLAAVTRHRPSSGAPRRE